MATIMVVDDVKIIRHVLRDFLKSSGHDILLAEDGETALSQAFAYAGDIDLLITDIHISTMDGPALAARLKAARPALKVLYISASSREELHRKGIDLDGAAFLQKPFRLPDILEHIQALLTS